ncbi:UNVERIFIED_CONTAM: hypothetical protein GTU68_044759 [Idotea baltica]|nr:hypothetical protein [Idotea baltica]
MLGMTKPWLLQKKKIN